MKPTELSIDAKGIITIVLPSGSIVVIRNLHPDEKLKFTQNQVVIEHKD